MSYLFIYCILVSYCEAEYKKYIYPMQKNLGKMFYLIIFIIGTISMSIFSEIAEKFLFGKKDS